MSDARWDVKRVKVAFQKGILAKRFYRARQLYRLKIIAKIESTCLYLFQACEIAQLIKAAYSRISRKSTTKRGNSHSLVYRQFAIAITIPMTNTDGLNCRIAKLYILMDIWFETLPRFLLIRFCHIELWHKDSREFGAVNQMMSTIVGVG